MYKTLITASAGTGKTTYLINDIIKKLKEGYAPEDIAFCSFTTFALEEAKDRIERVTGINRKKFIYFRTIHSFCYKELGIQRKDIMTHIDYMSCGKAIGYNLKKRGSDSTYEIEDLDFDDLVDDDIANLEQLYRNNKKLYQARLLKEGVSSRIFDYMSKYKEWRLEHNKYDFTDLLELYLEQGKSSSCKIAYLDEAQDCTQLQWQVVLSAFNNVEKLYVAGDVKQAIYAHLGGVGNFMELLVFDNIEVLDMTYRVPREILKIGNALAKIIDKSYCETKKEGGEVLYATEIGLVENHLVEWEQEGSVFLLSYKREHREVFEELCWELGLNYSIEDEPYITLKDFVAVKAEMNTDFKNEIAVRQYAQKHAQWETPRINIGTIHSVKGREADTVVVLTDVPKKLLLSDIDQAVLYNVFYVAVTRAKKRLVILDGKTEYRFETLKNILTQLR